MEEPVPRFIEALYRASAGLSLVAGWLAALIMLGMTLHILTEIVLRSFFDTSTHLVEEYVGYGLKTMIFLGLGHALERGNLVRVDLMLDRLGSGALRCGMEIAICVTSLCALAFILHYAWFSMARRYEMGTVSMTLAATPLWIPEAIVVVGMVVFGIQLAAYAFRIAAGGPLIDDRQSLD